MIVSHALHFDGRETTVTLYECVQLQEQCCGAVSETSGIYILIVNLFDLQTCLCVSCVKNTVVRLLCCCNKYTYILCAVSACPVCVYAFSMYIYGPQTIRRYLPTKGYGTCVIHGQGRCIINPCCVCNNNTLRCACVLHTHTHTLPAAERW